MSTLTASPVALRSPVRASRPARPGAGRAGGPAVRVRWDRLAGLVVAVAVLVGVIVGGWAGASQADAPAPAPVHVVVQPGDTLWDLARAHAPAGMATLEYVAWVEQVNGVRAGVLVPGTPLELPQG